MAKDSGKSKRLWRLAPPERLRPVPARLRLPVQLPWLAFLAIAVGSQAGGVWRGLVQANVVDQRFAAVGLVTSYAEEGEAVLVAPATRAAARAGVPAQGRIVAIDGRPAPPVTKAALTEEATAARLAGPDGAVTVRIRAPDGRTADYRLRRGEAVRAEALDGPISPLGYYLFLAGMGALGAGALLVAAVLLVRRRPKDPVALLLSLSFLAATASLERPMNFYMWLGADWLGSVMPSIWLGLMVAALPAFPDGRFVPRWGGWLAVVALPLAIFLAPEETPELASNLVAAACALAAVACPIIRYRRSARGLERQQLKWAAFGFAASVMLLIGVFTVVAILESDLLPESAHMWGALLTLAMFNISFMLLPLGVLVAILRFRLWDADAAIGRSLSYAAITLVLAGVWAASSEMVEQLLTGQLGDGSAPVAASIGTIIAAVVFGPASDRINGWIDRRFQPGLVKLRKLPDKLQLWQHEDTPEEVGGRVVDAIVECLHARQAAILLHTETGYVMLAADSIAPGEVTEWIAARHGGEALKIDNLDRRDPLFPLRLLLEDAGKPIGALLLGPRSDGNIYAKEERAALDALEPPLAAALRQTQRRRKQEARLGELIGRLEARLAQLEPGPTPA